MTKLISHLSILCLFLCLYHLTFAQAKDTIQLSPEEAVRIGLSNNLNIEMKEMQVNIAEMNTGAGAAGMLPTINASASANYSLENTNQTFIDGSDVVSTGAQTYNVSGVIKADWVIFSGMQLSIQKDLLDLESETSMLELKEKTFNLTADILTKYQEIIYYNEYEQILLKNRDYITDLLQLSEQKKKLGSATELDVLQAKTDLLDIENTYELTQMQKQIAKSDLNLLLQQNVTNTFAVDTTFIKVTDRSYGEWAEIAMKNNYELKLQERKLQRTSLLIDREKGGLWPQINLNAAVNYNYLRANSGFLTANNSYGPTIGISAQYNLYDGGRVQRNIDIAQVQKEIQLTQKVQTQRRTKNALFLTYQQYNFYKEQIRREKENLKIVNKNLTLANKMFKAGRINQFDLRQVRQQLLNMERRLIVAQLNESKYYIELKRLSGSPFY